MALTPGTIVGPYEILGLLGAGGMGEVYRARDTHLNREVALKTLPSAVSTDPDRLARFKREAQILASLNHSNIGGIHGFEDSGGVQALVLELVDGPTLEDRLARGPIPPDETWPIAHQICDALEAAHERGIVHRDLKPANIKVRPDGSVKVLDFGLAKALDPITFGSSPDLTASPTITSPAMTRAGVILGTAAYMSPEQARGAPVDARTDVWAFGCVLYEMLTGRRAFPGETVSDAIAAILAREPAWDALPATTPESVRRVLRRCLVKDSKLRLRHIADARIDIDEAATAPMPRGPAGGGAIRITRDRSPWLVGAAAAIVAAILSTTVAWSLNATRVAATEKTPVARVFVDPTEPLASSAESLVAVSPDGQHLAYVGGQDRERRLYVRDIDQFESKPIQGTEGADYPTFSPDGRWLAFVSDRRIKKIAVNGGTPLVLCEAAGANALSWSASETIVFSQGLASGIWAVQANGGKPTEITRLGANEIHHQSPDVLPDGQAILYSDFAGSGGQQIYAQSLKTGARHRVATGVAARYLPTGHVVYVSDGTLYGMPFDSVRLEATGQPIPLITGILQLTAGPTPQISISQSGTLVYLSGAGQERQDSLVWVDREGRETTAAPVGGSYAVPRLSPNGKRLAVRFGDSTKNTGDVHLYDFASERWNRVTTSGNITFILWTRDSAHMTLGEVSEGRWKIYTQSLDGSTPNEQLLSDSGTVYPLSWSPDDSQLAIVTANSATAMDIAVLDRRKPGTSEPFLNSKDREGGAAFSPDGHWIAYVSDKSGDTEIYLRPYPGPGEEVTVSTDGGNELKWARDAPLLFYRRDDAMMVVDVVTSPTLSVGKPRRLFERPYARSGAFWPNYDVTPDGQRLLMIKRVDESTPTKINVVLNWFDELKRRVPISR